MKTNNLRFRTSKTVGKEFITVEIRLNDECKNGHQNFAITGDIYEAGKPKTDRYYISGGCIHETIEKYFPEFIPFIRLHLCDYKGIPMHASANGFYHLKNGFNRTPVISENFKKEFCNYYRLTESQFDSLKETQTEIQFAIVLIDLGVLKQWQDEASKAIKQLEQLTDNEFVIDSVRTQWHVTNKQIKEEKKKIAEGYYLPEKVAERKRAKIDQVIEEMEAETEKKIKELKIDLDLDIQLYKLGGRKYKYGLIYYKHTNKLKFNWSSNDLSIEEIAHIKENLILPIGATYEN